MAVNRDTVPSLVLDIVNMLQRRGAWCVYLNGEPTIRKGIPRILACYEGRFLAVAVKAPRGPGPTRVQRLELAALDQSGAITMVARSVCEVEAVLDDIHRNPPEVLALERLIA
jgi:hypothetical protein